MADDPFLITIAVDAANVQATLLSIANGLAQLHGEVDGLDGPLSRIEKYITDVAIASENASRAISAQGKSVLDLKVQLYDQAQAYERVNAAEAKSTETTIAKNRELEIASKQTALYNQYLYDEAIAADRAAAAQSRLGQSLSTTRYALFSSAQTLTTLGAGLLAVAALPVIVSSKFQSEFAQVTRTVQGAGKAIEDQLISLSQTIPVTFKSLTEIATLGGQLGIDKSGIVEFTRTVAELTATTNLTSEAAGTVLGRFQALVHLPSSQFENLASSILKVGVNTVATETQIVAIATGIASISKIAGFTAPQIIGLSGALASLGDQPYLSRGVITRFFTQLGSSIAQAGPQLQEFSKVSGVAATQLQKDFGTDKFAGDFEKLVVGLGKMTGNSAQLSAEFAKLGITGTQAVHVFDTLAVSSDQLVKSNQYANSGFAQNAELQKQFAITAATTSSKVKELGSDFLAFFNAIGESNQGPIGLLVDQLANIVKGATELASNPVGQFFLTAGAGAGILLGVLLLLGAATAKAIGGIIGLTQALAGYNARETESIGIMAAFNAELAATGPAGSLAAKGLGVAGKAMALLPAALGVVALVGIVNTLGLMNDAAGQNKISFKSAADAAKAYNKEIGLFALQQYTRDPFGGQISNSQARGQALQSVTGPSADLGKTLGSAGLGGLVPGFTQANEVIKKIDASMATLVKGGNASTAAIEFDRWSKASKDLGITQADLAAQFPKYAAALAATAKKAAEAKKSVDDLNTGFGTQKDLVTALTGATGLSAKEQTAFGKAYIAGVKTLTDFNDIVGEVQTSLDASATKTANATGKPTGAYYDGISVSLDQFTAKLQSNNTEQAKWAQNLQTLSAQAGTAAAATFVQAGYSVVNQSILQQLIDATPAQRDAYIAAQTEAANLASQATANAILASPYIVSAGKYSAAQTAAAFTEGLKIGIPVEDLMAQLGLRFEAAPQPVVTPQVNTDPAQTQLNSFIARNNNRTINVQAYGGFASGGPISGPGTGTSDSIPARLSNGEYVIRASAVRQYGTGMFDALNRGVARFAGGGSVGGASSAPSVGMGVVELGPRSMGVLRDSLAKEMSVYLGDVHVAQAANRGNKQLNAMGVQ